MVEVTKEEVGRIGSADRAGGPSDLSRSTASQPEAPIPCAWRPIETLPAYTEALVCVTHNVPGEDGDDRPSAGNGYVWETVQWVDWHSGGFDWFSYPRLIEIPFPPTHWMPLPPAPASGIEAATAGETPQSGSTEGESPAPIGGDAQPLYPNTEGSPEAVNG